MRFAAGSLAETFGPRRTQLGIMLVFSIPLALSGLSTGMVGLTTARFFIGMIGATFVTTQLWTTQMFSDRIIGVATATTAGWGNLGGGFTMVMTPLIFSGFVGSLGPDVAWRVTLVVPAALLVLAAVAIYFFSDDYPYGRSAPNAQPKTAVSFVATTKQAVGASAGDARLWAMFIIYGGW
jgi:NNP family nitrate/nitrite transporter-like MFS transporter